MNSSVRPDYLLHRSACDHGIARNRFSTLAAPAGQQLLAWRERVGHIVDVVLPPRDELERPFRAAIDRHQAGGLVFTECRSDLLVMERSLARISTDSVRDYVFHVFLEGGIDDLSVGTARRAPLPRPATVVALDMSQPVRMRRQRCCVLTLFASAQLVQQVFPDPEAIHGRTLDAAHPLERMIVEHVGALAREIPLMDADTARDAIRSAVELLVLAFGREAGLVGNARAAQRAAMFGQVRRYVQAHLYDAQLTPDSVLAALQLPRRTLYRLFEHEGGLATYIRHLRLRQAASDLARYPQMSVTSIAYGLGFGSASDFTRAFRRAFQMAPQDFRARAAQSDDA